jgi:DNA modification methylase
MDSSEIKDLIAESIYRVIEEEMGIDKASIDGMLSKRVDELAIRVADELASQLAQREFEFLKDLGDLAKEEDSSSISANNRLNELTGSEWLWFTKSILRTSYPSILGHELRKNQGGNKPPQLMKELIEFFTKPGEIVLDPFAGAGGTALGAHLAGRRSVNIEINPESIDIYLRVCELEAIESHEFVQGDCREVLPKLKSDTFDFIATDPPYSPELEQTMSGEQANRKYGRQNRKSSYVTYSDDPRDLSKLESFEVYFTEMMNIGRELLRILKPKKYMAMILRDAYQDSKYIPTSSIIAQRYSEIGWVLKGDRIWYATGTRIRPYGYPNAFVPNIIHQNILIFRKE